LDNDSAAGTGTITLADSYAELRLLGTTGRSIVNALVISDTGDEKSLLFTQTGTATCSGDITINETNPDHFRVRTDSSNLTLAGKISGAGGINKYSGAATLLLTNGANDFTGGAKITVGTLDFAAGALGTTGAITMDGGILRWATGNTNDVSSRILMVNAKNASFSTNGNDVTFASPIGNSSTGNFVKTTTAGTLTLTGVNTYTGATTVGGGTLQVNGSLDPASAVTVTGGNLGGTGTIGGSVTVAAGGGIAPGASAGTLTIGGGLDVAAMAGGAGKLKFELGSNTANSDQIAVTGTLTLGIGALGFGDFEFTNLGTLAAGTYTLITSGGINPGDSLDGANLSGAIDAGFNGALSISGGNLVLEVTVAGSGFAAWQTANSTAGGLDDDHDGDGVSNGIEFFTYGPVANSGFTALPGVINTVGVLSVTWTKAIGYSGTYGSGFVVETSPDLQNPWTTETLGGTITISGPNNEFVTYTFPAGSKNFARLKVTGP
jgi:autotransporter-associated beta strand protein